MAVRQFIEKGLEDDVIVYIGSGRYYLRSILHFNELDSGTEHFDITYKALDSEKAPELIGGIQLTGWKKYQENIYVADIPENLNVKQVFENGSRMTLARAPNEGYFKTLKPVKEADQSSFFIREGDVDLSLDLSEARIFIWQGPEWMSHWFSQDKGIKSVQAESGILEMDNSGGYTIDSGNSYYIYNALHLLDRAGEAVIDMSDRKVYVWPKDGDINKLVITISTADNVIRVSGKPDNMAQHIHFENLDLVCTNADGVYFENARDCSLKFCKIANAHQMGIGIYHKSQNITIYGNEITQIGFRGVFLCGGYPTGQPYLNFGHQVVNNHIHHCGRLVGHGAGVQMLGSGDNQILNNHIHHMPRYGISLKGFVLAYLQKHVPEATPENRYDYIHAKNNNIAFNDIHHVNQETQDTGAIEAWGCGRDNVINNNLIHDFGTYDYNHQSGIYLDDAASYFMVTNNIIYGISGFAGNNSIFTKGIHNKIINNILIVGNGGDCSAIRSFEMAAERVDNHHYLNNIIYFEEGTPRLKDYPMVHEWEFDVSKAGEYRLWFDYAANAFYTGRENFYPDLFTLSVDNGRPQPIRELCVTHDMGYRWAKSIKLNLSKGNHLLRFVNPMGGGLIVRKMVLAENDQWKPENSDFQSTPNSHLIVTDPGINRDIWRTIYEFQNWSDARVASADKNIIWKQGDRLLIRKGPENITFDQWIRLHDNQFDQNSIVADPMFFDVENRDFRLKPESPALKLGFQQIDVSSIGLTKDYPARLSRR